MNSMTWRISLVCWWGLCFVCSFVYLQFDEKHGLTQVLLYMVLLMYALVRLVIFKKELARSRIDFSYDTYLESIDIAVAGIDDGLATYRMAKTREEREAAITLLLKWSQLNRALVERRNREMYWS